MYKIPTRKTLTAANDQCSQGQIFKIQKIIIL